jgi:Fe2+ or Zn2+ uptake regulation protein
MSRRAIVQALYDAGRPLTIPELLAEAGDIPQSSAYRNLGVLCEAGVARRLPGPDDFGRFELAEELAGHHHHLRCTSCGSVVDLTASARLERALAASAGEVAAANGFEVDGHSVEFSGHCPHCR